MKTTNAFTWRRPVIFNACLGAEISDLFSAAQERWVTEIIAASGVDTRSVKSAADLRALYDANYDRALTNYVVSAESASGVSWAVKLKDDSLISDLTIQQILSLPNVGSSALKIVSGAVGGAEPSIRIAFSDGKYSEGASITIRADFREAQQLRSEIETILRKYSRVWWPLRNGPFLTAAFAVMAILMNASTIVSAAFDKTPSAGMTIRDVFSYIIPGLAILLPLGFCGILFGVSCWGWLFPMVDYAFSGGEARSGLKAAMRKAAWAFPVMGIIVPIWVNRLSAEHPPQAPSPTKSGPLITPPAQPSSS